CHYHHSVQIKISAVSRSKMKPHMNEHYCLALVKIARVFATTFASNSLIISQNDKAKISLNMLAVNRTFKKYFAGTLSLSHIRNLINISKYDDFVSTLNNGDCLKSIWILLVERRPDENLKYLKNIVEYYCLFCKLDLDHLLVQIHALYQLAYNPVE
ncbi:10354_t:CDS:2, partial [Gigaspora margarita]